MAPRAAAHGSLIAAGAYEQNIGFWKEALDRSHKAQTEWAQLWADSIKAQKGAPKELAAMTDDEMLAHYRHKHGDPYLSLRAAREMHRAVFRWWHLTASAAKRNNEAQAD